MSEWLISRDMNMTRANVVGNLLHPENWSRKRNPAATPSALADWGFVIGRSPSPLGEAVIAGALSWQEACILSLAKRGPGDGDAAVKPFVAVMKTMAKMLSLPNVTVKLTERGFTRLAAISSYDDITDDFCLHLNESDRAGESGLLKYRDIWLNALTETGLFIENNGEFELVPSNSVRRFVKQVALNGENISSCPSKRAQSSDFYTYMGALETGLPEIFNSIDADVLRDLFPHYRGGMIQGVPSGVGGYNRPAQLITYGAPGTGKSHKIDKCTNESNSIRVTFHPDTDYAAFVGAYKPTMESSDKGLLTLQELQTVLQSLKDRGETRPEQKLGAEFWRSFEKLTPAEVKSILENDSMYAEVMKGVAVGEYLTRIENGGKQIVYSFVPQAFMKAYVEAWRRYTNAGLEGDAKTYYLVIEEINRGNCAQIFGDLFQLLDRADNGFSAYAITPDDDIQKFLETDKDYRLTDISLTEDIKKVTEAGEKVIATATDIKSGKKLVLPPNLFIRATMNTSDQSLFPMDSAFKRRWDWEYVPIKDAGKGWKIKFGDCEKEWWKFLVAINKIVKGVTNSADKQLGYFFVKAKDSVIDAEMFVNKVAFYLWNDVFKDCELDYDAFKITREGGEVDVLAFQDFFKDDGTIDEEVLKDFLRKLVPQPETALGESEAGSAADGEA